MAIHDRYDNDILKALQKIANSLDRIMKKLPDNFIGLTMDESDRNCFSNSDGILLCNSTDDKSTNDINGTDA